MAKKVMIVDDSIVVRQQVAWALLQAGYEVVEATNGEEGLAKAETTADLAMIICDVNMPLLNGLGMLERLQDQGLLSRCPVVMLTSEGQPELIAKAKALGAKGWMVKPVSSESLVATVKKLAV